MKNIRYGTLALCLCLTALTAHPQDIVKTGFNFGVLPAVSFSTDMGFQYGAIINLFNYGDGSHYPAYDHSLYLEASRYTKGGSVLRMYYESDQLIKGVSTFIDLGLIGNDMQDFYGYNGLSSLYLPSKNTFDYTVGDATKSRNTGFYRMRQQKLYAQGDFRGNLGPKNLYWLGGLGVYDYTMGDLNFDKLNKNKPENGMMSATAASLYDVYCSTGLIDEAEKDGGWLTSVKAGLMYDSRDKKTNPSKGAYTEALLEWAVPGLSESPYLAYSVTHRQYVGLVPNRLNLAARIAVQGTIGDNKMPLYRKTQMITTFAKRSMTMGMGGSYTVRGVLQSRMIGDAIGYANVELRWKVFNFKLGKQNIYIGLNPFWDAGYVIDPVDWNLNDIRLSMGVQQAVAILSGRDYPSFSDCFSEKEDILHQSIGCGLKIAMNENFVISCDAGKALNKQDNDGLGVYINLNYLF